jgi:hypothetical protein
VNSFKLNSSNIDASSVGTSAKEDGNPGDQSETGVATGRGLLTALADIWLAGLIRDDEYYHQGLSWLLQQLSEKSEDARILLLEKGITFEAAKAAQTSRDALVYIHICVYIYIYMNK